MIGSSIIKSPSDKNLVEKHKNENAFSITITDKNDHLRIDEYGPKKVVISKDHAFWPSPYDDSLVAMTKKPASTASIINFLLNMYRQQTNSQSPEFFNLQNDNLQIKFLMSKMGVRLCGSAIEAYNTLKIGDEIIVAHPHDKLIKAIAVVTKRDTTNIVLSQGELVIARLVRDGNSKYFWNIKFYDELSFANMKTKLYRTIKVS